MYEPKDLTTFPIESGVPQPYPYGGRTKPSIIARLRRLRPPAIARWRPRLLLRGWRQICFYSFDLATSFLRAFRRLTPRLGLIEMALWTDCAVKLARCDRVLAAQFFSEGADLLLRVPAGVGRLFCQALVARDGRHARMPRCHRLVRWSLTMAATAPRGESLQDATGLSGGVSRWQLPLHDGESLQDATGLSGGVSRCVLLGPYLYEIG